MLNKESIILDVLELIICVIGMVVFTFTFLIVTTEQKYLFLICDLYVIFRFSSCFNAIGKSIKRPRVLKNSKSRVSVRGLSKVLY